MNSVFEQNKDKLLSIGFAFHGKVPRKAADPEKAIVDLLPSFFVDRKLFRMLLTWLNIITEFIHIERLKPLSKDLSPNLKAILGVLAKKLLKQDRRWNLIYEHMKSELRGKKLKFELPREFNDPYLVAKYGRDNEFADFGIDISKVEPADQKKILTLKGIFQSNRWLRLRALMGPNFRSDIAYLYLSGAADGPPEAARILGCSRDTAYRNWRYLEEADAKRILKLPG